MSSSAEAHYESLTRPLDSGVEFTKLGVPKHVWQAVESAFPTIRHPTACQSLLIPALLNAEGRDIIMRDRTGTGKSFGLMLALLSKKQPQGVQLPSSSSMIIVPHRDLALQLHYWASRLSPPSSDSDSEAKPSSDIQVAIRGHPGLSIESQIESLHNSPPRILIGTAQALLDIYDKDARALHVSSLDLIAVDEIDYLLGLPTKRADVTAWKNFRRHPSALRRLLDGIFKARPKSFELEKIDNEIGEREPGQSKPIRLVAFSATLSHHTRRFLYSETKWMSRDVDAIRIDLSPERERVAGIEHHALVVSQDGRAVNLTNYQIKKHKRENAAVDDAWDGNDMVDQDGTGAAIRSKISTAVQPTVLETMAFLVARDVQQLALAVFPSGAPLQVVVQELAELGVNARLLDFREDMQSLAGNAAHDGEGDEPVLLVSTHASTRGIDLVPLSHVFIVGVPPTEVVYQHLAGRVGRSGKSGKVITVLSAEQGKTNEPLRMSRMLTRLGVELEKIDEIL
ncbi:P-loop containing nucleoside triphosphate hydrolase protein [Sistotremastrum niveocremeum HHB9708]|uniref:RNA helicase n=1 Tax=Sistotremastrum niveocremeum HHB9708 TaxID=1314777 RepID=A0A164UC32_9AGAM|nr:P-loop containing nucleoside triphosphate hydrolase protein [Sistotremastrum niveocremeum HHB9708]